MSLRFFPLCCTFSFLFSFIHVVHSEEANFHFDGSRPVGTVEQVYGDLAYISGLNGSASVLSRLQVSTEIPDNTAQLEVIKVLDRLLVARILNENGHPVQISDKVFVTGDMSPSERLRALRVVHAAQTGEGPKLDGRLDDEVWKKALPVEGFVQRDPGYWTMGSERTVARILYDSDKIYLGFECYDSEPEKLVANNMRRDSELRGDDNIQILLDTYDDRQTGVYLIVNPLGAQQDLLLSQEGRTRNEDWDCIWDVKTRRHSKGWTAEVAIPFDQLRFKEGDDIAWGINLSRNIARKNEQVALMVGRKSPSPFQAYWTSDLAELRGLRSMETKRVFQVKPYALPGALKNLQSPNPSTDTNIEVGVDVRYGITPNMTLDLSYNTDFAQVEGDQEQVNLTQFRLFFPEKREFFLEGATLFDFGEAAQSRAGDIRPPTLLFYSRRVGLEGGRPVPILLGSKLTGKAGGTSVGALMVLSESDQTRDVSDFSVFRVKQDLFSRSNVGLIFVNKQTDGIGVLDPTNRAGGVDFFLSPSREINIQGFYARTWDSKTGDTDDARFLEARYSGGVYEGRFSYLEVEDNFNPGAGFVNRRRGLSDMRKYFFEGSMRPRPGIPYVRSVTLRPRVRVFSDMNNNVKFWDGRFTWWTNFVSGDWYRIIEVDRIYDVVDQPFRPSLRNNLTIPPGAYRTTVFRIGPSTSRARRLRLRITLEAGSYFTGRRYRTIVESFFKPSGRFTMETVHEANWIRLPQGNLNVQVLSNRFIYSITTDFFIKLFGQWNNDRELVSANFLLNYRFRPGSDLFLVYDQGYGTQGGLHERNRALLLKLSYLIGL